MFRFIDSPQRETFLLIVYSKLEILADSAAFAVHMIVTLRICSIIDIMFNLTQMKMRGWGIDIQVCCTDTYIPCTKDILRDVSAVFAHCMIKK